MLTTKQRKAVKLMFRVPDDEVAQEIGVLPRTITSWKQKTEFIKAVDAEVRAVRTAAARIAADAALTAAASLRKQLSNAADVKICIDVLKAAETFKDKESLEGDLEDDFYPDYEGEEDEDEYEEEDHQE